MKFNHLVNKKIQEKKFKRMKLGIKENLDKQNLVS